MRSALSTPWWRLRTTGSKTMSSSSRPSPPGTDVGPHPEGLGPIVISGEGWDGYLTSNSTQRTGLVTNLDVTATALDVLGLERPVQVLGNAMVTEPAPAELESRVAILDRMNRTAVASRCGETRAGQHLRRGDGRLAVARSRCARACTPLEPCSGSAMGRRPSRCTSRGTVDSRRQLVVLRLDALAADARGVRSVALLSRPRPFSALGCLLMWKAPMRVPVAVLSLLTSAVIIVDQLLGAPASFTNFFGYSPLLAARFYGMGNEAAAILVGSSIVGIALLFDQWPESRWTALGKLYGIPLLGIVVVSTAAAPFWGANIGVAIWGVVGFGLAWVLMNGRHVSGKTVLWLVRRGRRGHRRVRGDRPVRGWPADAPRSRDRLGRARWMDRAVEHRRAQGRDEHARAHPHELGVHPGRDTRLPRIHAMAAPR